MILHVAHRVDRWEKFIPFCRLLAEGKTPEEGRKEGFFTFDVEKDKLRLDCPVSAEELQDRCDRHPSYRAQLLHPHVRSPCLLFGGQVAVVHAPWPKSGGHLFTGSEIHEFNVEHRQIQQLQVMPCSLHARRFLIVPFVSIRSLMQKGRMRGWSSLSATSSIRIARKSSGL